MRYISFVIIALLCFLNVEAQNEDPLPSFNIHKEIIRVKNQWGSDTSGFQTALRLSDSMLLGKWVGYLWDYKDPAREKFQKLDIKILKVIDSLVSVRLWYYQIQSDTSQPTTLVAMGDYDFPIKNGHIMLSYMQPNPLAPIIQSNQNLPLTIQFISNVDGYWIYGEYPDNAPIRYYGVKLGHSYKIITKPTLVHTASQKVVDEARRENEALIGKRDATGSPTPKGLAKMIFNAFKTNNASAYVKCIVNGSKEDWKEEVTAFAEAREEFERLGLSDNWSKATFSRVEYGGKNPRYLKFIIEFSIPGTDFIGIIRPHHEMRRIKEQCYIFSEDDEKKGAQVDFFRRR